jgi:hypothetical protein
MSIRRKPMLRTASQRSPHSAVNRGELMKANLKRFNELMQRSQGVAAAAAAPAPPAPPPHVEQAVAPPRPAVGEVISPLPGDRAGFSGVRMAQAARQVRASILTARDLVREGTGQFLATPPGIDQIVAEAHRIADLAVMSVQHTGEIAEITTAQALSEAQWQKKKPEVSSPAPDATAEQRSTPA